MNPYLVFGIIGGYFLVLILISVFTSRGATNFTFFSANRRAPWYLVAFGMIGASLSGVTFISVPGEVGNSAFSYFQIVLGYLVGYFMIAKILLPLYYKLNLVSIYSYLENRFGKHAYKTGSIFFLISQTIGASFRLFLVALVLQIGFFNLFGIPFYVTVLITLLLILLYTFRGGIKTIVWTDTLQTAFMLASVIICIFIIGKELGLSFSGISDLVIKSDMSKIFHWDWKSGDFFPKQFLAGAFIAIVMTGLDQNMMQKNLTCRTLKDAQKNMYWFSISLIFVNLLFLSLGVLLYHYAISRGIDLKIDPVTGNYIETDKLFPNLAIGNFSTFAGIIFLLGITAAAFSSADSALTALTTSFCTDFLKTNRYDGPKSTKMRHIVHIGFAVILFLVIILFRAINDDSVINAVFKIAGYTYGPLLGLFSFGLFSRYRVKDKSVPYIAVLSPIITYFIDRYSETIMFGYKFNFEVLILNGLLTFTGLLIFREKTK
ncbi:MAG: sodium:solute symporter [Bacteroidota bacterium]